MVQFISKISILLMLFFVLYTANGQETIHHPEHASGSKPIVVSTPVHPSLENTEDGKLAIKVHPGSMAFWFSIALINGDSSSKVEMKDSGAITSYTEFELSNWGYYLFPSNPTPLVPPLYIKVTSATTGVSIDVVINEIIPGELIDSGLSLTSPPSTASSSSPSASSSSPSDSPSSPSDSSSSSPSPASYHSAHSGSTKTTDNTLTTETLKVQVHSGASPVWFPIALINGEKAVKVELKDSGSLLSYTPFSKTEWGYWLFPVVAQPLVEPLYVKVSSSEGKSVLVNLRTFGPGTVVDSGVFL